MSINTDQLIKEAKASFVFISEAPIDDESHARPTTAICPSRIVRVSTLISREVIMSPIAYAVKCVVFLEDGAEIPSVTPAEEILDQLAVIMRKQ